jgi:hypothetical protein
MMRGHKEEDAAAEDGRQVRRARRILVRLRGLLARLEARLPDAGGKLPLLMTGQGGARRVFRFDSHVSGTDRVH